MKKNKKTKQAREAQVRAQLGIETRRGETFTGLRPCVFADRSKYDRKKTKQETRRMVGEEDL